MDRTTFAAVPKMRLKHPCAIPAGVRFRTLAFWQAAGLGSLLAFGISQRAGAQVLLDDFNRPTSTTVGGGWTETETAASGAQIIAAQQLQMGSATAGRDYIFQDMSAAGLYLPTFNSNTCLMTWAFCMRQSRPIGTPPSGFDAGNYGVAFVLGATSSNFI